MLRPLPTAKLLILATIGLLLGMAISGTPSRAVADGDSPANDDRADATVITALPFAEGPTNHKNVTREAGEPESACFLAGADTVWYSFTAAEDARLIAESGRRNTSTVIAVWYDDGSELTEIACGSSFKGARVVFQVAANETYLIQVDGFRADDDSSMDFGLEAGVPPSNDDIANATHVASLPFSDTVDLAAANREPDEPSCGRGPSSVWYSYTPADDVFVVATVGGLAGKSVAAWAVVSFGLSEVACTSGISQNTRRVGFLAEAGRTYLLQAGHIDTGEPDYLMTLDLAVGVPPANDNVADAEAVPSLPYAASFDTLAATNEEDEPHLCDIFAIRNTAWYEFTPVDDTFVLAESAGDRQATTPVVAAYTSTAHAGLTLLDCALGRFGDPAKIGLQLEGGQTYFLQAGFAILTIESVLGGSPEGAVSGVKRALDDKGSIDFSVKALDVPDCQAPAARVSDPLGDLIALQPPDVPSLPDVTSIGVSTAGEWSCIAVTFAEPIDQLKPESSVFAAFAFDIDMNRSTGEIGRDVAGLCSSSANLGFDRTFVLDANAGLLSEIMMLPGGAASPTPILLVPTGMFAIAFFDERSISIAVPLEALGGDDSFRYAMFAGSGLLDKPTDCAPNGGIILSPEPAEAGDVNCDGLTDSRDSYLLLQLAADRQPNLLCRHAADVNGDGAIGPLDALLVLQYDAGLLVQLPP